MASFLYVPSPSSFCARTPPAQSAPPANAHEASAKLRSQRMDGDYNSGSQPTERVDRIFTAPHFEVEVRAFRGAGVADEPDDLILVHAHPLLHLERLEVCVQRVKTTVVLEDHQAPEAFEPFCIRDAAAEHRAHFGGERRADVDPLLHHHHP